LEKPNRCNWL